MTKIISEYRNFSILDITRGIKNNDFTKFEILNSCVHFIEKYEEKINAWESFLDLENKLFIEDTSTNSNLIGVPFGVKDVINTKHFNTEMGSKIWENHKAGNNARIVSRFFNSGALLIGKTVTSEFAVDGKNKTRNPWNTNLVPGTSSSGSAAAVAAGMVPVTVGTQTLGSIIRPASWCGVYGMKPTYGLIPRTGILKTTDTLDTVGFFTRSVNDMKLLLEETVLNDDNHPTIKQNLSDQAKINNSFKLGYLKISESKNDSKLYKFINKLCNIK